jgi:hypothetical protein
MLFPTFFGHYSTKTIPTDFEIVCEMSMMAHLSED